ncbi:MAG: glycosyltransferase [Gammaproteobacteria bacterium]
MIANAADAGDLKAYDDYHNIAVITVTFNPDVEVLERQLSQLPPAALKVVVDNASRPELQNEVRQVTARYAAILLQNETNKGLPAALNQGARHAQIARPASRLLLLLDQDTEPGTGNVERLVASYDQIASTYGRASCIGPRLVDVSTELDYGFHQIRLWRWSRSFPDSYSQTPVPIANLNGSGTLIPFALFNELDGLEEDLFIDLVDTEWSFRVLAAGYHLFGVPNIAFQHRMGERGLRFWWFGLRVWPYRSPQRHYFLFRNAMRLMRRNYIPWVWKSWAVIKLGLTFVIYAIFDTERGAQVSNMLKGVCEGARTFPRDNPSENRL